MPTLYQCRLSECSSEAPLPLGGFPGCFLSPLVPPPSGRVRVFSLWDLIYPVRIPGGAGTTMCGVLLFFVSPGPHPDSGSEMGLNKYCICGPPGDCEHLELWENLPLNSGRQDVNVFDGIFHFSWTKTSYR